MFSCFFATIIFFVIVYVYYEKPESLPKLNAIPYIRRFNDYRIFSSPFVFARFENTHNDGEYENITVNMETAPSIMDLTAESAFKNPISSGFMAAPSEETKLLKFSESVSFKKSSATNDNDDDDGMEETPLDEINIETIESN